MKLQFSVLKATTVLLGQPSLFQSLQHMVECVHMVNTVQQDQELLKLVLVENTVINTYSQL